MVFIYGFCDGNGNANHCEYSVFSEKKITKQQAHRKTCAFEIMLHAGRLFCLGWILKKKSIRKPGQKL